MAGRKSGRDLEKEKQWIGVIRRWQASGLAQMEFCRREGLSDKRFYYWYRQLQQRKLIKSEKATVEVKETSGPVFLPVEVKTLQEPMADSSAVQRLEIVTPGGYVVRIP